MRCDMSNKERYTKDEYNYIIFESLIHALAALEEMYRECKIDYKELKRYIKIKSKLYSITSEILEMKEKDT